MGEENVPENALSRNFLDPSERASGLLCRGFSYRKNTVQSTDTGGGWKAYRMRGVPKTTLGRGVIHEVFHPPSFFHLSWRPLNPSGFKSCYNHAIWTRGALRKNAAESLLNLLSCPKLGGSQKGGFQKVVSADVPPERKPERGYVRQNHPFTKPPFYLPVISIKISILGFEPFFEKFRLESPNLVDFWSWKCFFFIGFEKRD